MHRREKDASLICAVGYACTRLLHCTKLTGLCAKKDVPDEDERQCRQKTQHEQRRSIRVCSDFINCDCAHTYTKSAGTAATRNTLSRIGTNTIAKGCDERCAPKRSMNGPDVRKRSAFARTRKRMMAYPLQHGTPTLATGLCAYARFSLHCVPKQQRAPHQDHPLYASVLARISAKP